MGKTWWHSHAAFERLVSTYFSSLNFVFRIDLDGCVFLLNCEKNKKTKCKIKLTKSLNEVSFLTRWRTTVEGI